MRLRVNLALYCLGAAVLVVTTIAWYFEAWSGETAFHLGLIGYLTAQLFGMRFFFDALEAAQSERG